MNGLIGRKLGMARLFDEEGAHVPVTVIEAGPCPVVQLTGTQVQLGFGATKPVRTPKALLGHAKRAGLETAPRVLQNFPVPGEGDSPKSGEAVTVAIFKTGDVVHSSPALLDGTVFIGSWDTYLYALDAATGKEKWRFKTGEDHETYNQVGIQGSPAVAGGG